MIFICTAGPAARFVRSDDTDDIADAVIAVLTDPELRRALAERGRRFVRERLSWSRAADNTLATYRAALARHPPP